MKQTTIQLLRALRHRLERKKLPPWKRTLYFGLIVGAAGLLAGIFLFMILILFFSIGLPNVESIRETALTESTRIFDRNGTELYSIHGEENRKVITLTDISETLQNATIAIEDDQFYEHSGFDVPALGKAVIHQIFGFGEQRGGSTITQQLARNAFLTREKTYSRKIKELILAVKLEYAFEKEEILEMYLNKIPYGSNAYGAELGAQTYFNKSAKDLTLAESAIMAGIPQAPTYYSPYGQHRYSSLVKTFTPEEIAERQIASETDLKDEELQIGLIGATIDLTTGAPVTPDPASTTQVYLHGRVDLVLKRMAELGMITEEEKELAEEETHTVEFKKFRENIRAAHFVMYVKQLLEDQYGKELVEQGGLKVTTTIDWTLQEKAETIIAQQVEERFAQYEANNASLVAMDPHTGQIVTMVGSADYFDEDIDGNVNVALRPRQPGSSFKPIVYALGFLKNLSPATVIYDVATAFGPDHPKNYDGAFRGPMSIREALGQSRNIPAIKTYFLAGQQDEIIDFAKLLGVNSLSKEYSYGWPLALGAGEVTPLEMANAFSTFANEGVYHAPVAVLKIEKSNGDLLYEYKEEQGTVVLDPQVAYLISSILSDQGVNIGPRLNVAGHTVAVKTGTSTKKLENGNIFPSNLWTIGYTPSLAVAVWAGNTDGDVMTYLADGYNVATPIWNAFFTEALKDKPNEPFVRPEGITDVTVSKASGKLPSTLTPADMVKSEMFASFALPQEEDDNYVSIVVDTLCNGVATELTPPDAQKEKVFRIYKEANTAYDNWQTSIDEWAKTQEGYEMPPTETCNRTEAQSENIPTLSIVSPLPFSTVIGGKNTVTVDIDAPNGIDHVEYYFDDNLQYIAKNDNAETGYIRISELTTKTDIPHTITVKVIDKYYYSANTSIEVQYNGE